MKSTLLNTYRKGAQVGASIAAIGLMVALTGCGGTKTSNNSIRSTVASTPTAYGLDAQFLTQGTSEEVSGLESADESVLFATAATASTSVPINLIQGATGTIPLGFSSGAAFQNGSVDHPNVGTAYVPGQSSASVRFRVTLSNGTDANGTTYGISSATLTSPDLPGQVIPLTFSPNTSTTYGLANATYVTVPFNLPASLTTGLHFFTVSVTDNKPQTTTTTYEVVVVRPGDAAVLVLTSAATASAPGGSVSITNPIAGTINPTTGDQQGEAVLFASPGTQTVTGPTTTKNVTLVAGQLSISDSAAL